MEKGNDYYEGNDYYKWYDDLLECSDREARDVFGNNFSEDERIKSKLSMLSKKVFENHSRLEMILKDGMPVEEIHNCLYCKKMKLNRAPDQSILYGCNPNFFSLDQLQLIIWLKCCDLMEVSENDKANSDSESN